MQTEIIGTHLGARSFDMVWKTGSKHAKASDYILTFIEECVGQFVTLYFIKLQHWYSCTITF